MTEVKVIKKAIKRDNRSAYRMAKAADNAYVINGRTIYRVSSNGSGKSTITAIVHKDFDLGVYVNADEINRAIQTKGGVDFGDFQITLNSEVFLKGLKDRYPEYVGFVEVSGNSLLVTQTTIGDYLAIYVSFKLPIYSRY